jgi:hypothetical protein
MGAGQTATNQLTGAAGQLGTGLAQGYGNMGQAQASGYVGMGQAAMGATQGISNAVQGYYNNQFMNNFMNRQSSYGGGDIGRSYAAQQAGFANNPGMYGPYPTVG